MTRSSRHKSHKQSKHSAKEAKEYSDSEGEDVKMKEKERGGEKEGSGSGRVSKDSGGGEKRKLASQLKDGGKLGKDPSGHGNGDAGEEYVSFKRRKEKEKADTSGGGERRNGGGDDVSKSSKSKEKGTSESKSRSSKRNESGGEKKVENVASVVMEKEESRSGNRSESKRKSEKDSGNPKESREMERGLEREKKGLESKRDSEAYTVDGDVTKKQTMQSDDFGEDSQGKRSRNNTEWSMQDESRNPELDKESEKRIRKRREGSGDGDKYQDDFRDSDERRLSSRGDRAKEGRYRDEKHKEGKYGDKYQEDGGKDDRPRGNKYREDTDRDNKRRDDKYWDDGDRDSRRRDDKYNEDGDIDRRRRDDKYSEDGDRDNRRKNDKYLEDGERDYRRQDDEYREVGERENICRDEKYREDGDKDSRRSDGRYHEDPDRDGRRKDEKYREDGDRDNRHKEEKHRDDYERESRHRDGKQADEADREKRIREAKYREDRASRNRSGDKPDTKHLKDETHAADLHSRKSSMHDYIPGYDDRITRYKDDQGRRKTSAKEDQSDIRSRSTKDQLSDAEKRSASTGRVDLVTERGRSTSRTDIELTAAHSRRRSSPSLSTHITRDYYRLSKLDESKYRDYAYEERARHSGTSGRDYAGAGGVSEKKLVQKDDSHFSELTAERRLKSDSRTSPMQLMDKSPSSTSTERRHLSRSDVRRSLDVEEPGQRSGGSRDVKDYSSREGRGSRGVPMETLPGDEFSQADGDNFSISSPFTRTNHLSSSSKSLLPLPPLRLGVDSPLSFGASGDDSRGKSNSRQRRIVDPNMGRVQGNAWRGVPNWPSPIANGFMPFQHGPSPVGFHPMMQQFPPPPIFSVRPSMELNHPGVPYHVPDADRFSGHGRLMGWRNPVDDSCPPPLHGWDANKAVFSEESDIFGRPDWDHGRTLPSGRSWETSGDMWKGSNSGASAELPSASEKDNYLRRGGPDESLGGQSGQQAQHEQSQTDLQAESNETSQPTDAPERKTTSKISPEETPITDEKSKTDEARLCHFYLSKLDISADLTEPELYVQCIGLLDVEESNVICDADDFKILYMEVKEAAETKVATPNKISSSPLFAAVNDSVFQKAVDLHKKHKEESKVIKRGCLTLPSVENEAFPKSGQEKLDVESGLADKLAMAGDGQPENKLPSFSEVTELPASIQNGVSATANQKAAAVDVGEDKAEESVFTTNSASMEVQVTSHLEATDHIMEEISVSVENAGQPIGHSPAKTSDLEATDRIIEESSVSVENVGQPINHSPAKIEDLIKPTVSIGDFAGNNEEKIKFDTKCGPLLFNDVPSEACEAIVRESIESGSVNLSRIHHSPESTH